MLPPQHKSSQIISMVSDKNLANMGITSDVRGNSSDVSGKGKPLPLHGISIQA